MGNRKNRYPSYIYKGILFILYFFLLAPQCNSRFYTIANFYLFSPRLAHVSTAPVIKNNIATTAKKAANTRHLSLDKRFRNTDSYNNHLAANITDPLVIDPYGKEIKKQFFSFEQAHTNALLHSTSLRGPPMA